MEEKMNKNDLIDVIATSAEITKKDAEASLNALLESITNSLKKGESVTLVGFGTFSVTKRAAREGINPQTRAKIKIPAKKVAKFKAGKTLSTAIK
jgi:nucleoid DNA-binding protein